MLPRLRAPQRLALERRNNHFTLASSLQTARTYLVDAHALTTAAVPRGVSTAHPVFAVRAENAEIWDAEGKRYIDFVGGIGVQNTGHRHPKVVAAIEARRRKAKDKGPVPRVRRGMIRKPVYDDFGEPVRWEWVDQEAASS